jgi:hypothetical protein
VPVLLAEQTVPVEELLDGSVTLHFGDRKVTVKRVKSKVKALTLCLLVAALLTPILMSNVKAQGNGVTVGYWPLDEVKSSDSNVITPDQTGINGGIVVQHPTAPTLVDGKFDKAMQFNGENGVYIPLKFVIGFPPTPQPIYVPISPNLDIQKQVDIQAWINVQAFKDVTYNNIVVKCNHPDQACAWQNTTRVLGVSLRAGTPETGEQYVTGALSGYVLTDQGFNEIVTTQSVPLSQWIQVEFSRTSTGMHLYINGYEQNIKVINGVQNPQGNIINGTEYYFGHDAIVTMDDVKIVDLDPSKVSEAAFDIGPNIMVAAIVVSVIFAVAWLLRRLVQLWLIRPKL